MQAIGQMAVKHACVIWRFGRFFWADLLGALSSISYVCRGNKLIVNVIFMCFCVSWFY